MSKLEQINKITQGFIGQQCVRAIRTYNTMFILDFGKQHAITPHNKYPKYDWSLLVENCHYLISNNNQELAHQNTDIKVLEEVLSRFVDLKIIDLQLSEDDNDTTFVFEGGYSIFIHPINNSEAWDLQDPQDYYLGVGPKNKWEYIPSNAVPQSYD